MKQLLCVKETAEYFGVPESTIRYWVFTRRLRHYKIGRHLKFDKSDLSKFLESNLVEDDNNGRI